MPRRGVHLLWGVLFALLTIYVAVRMGAFELSVAIPMLDGEIVLPNTYASVDHPFHVARAEILWRSIADGLILRWIGQHQGGYPVEFYPLGAPWLEVAIRAISLGTLSAEGAHTLAVIAIFLLPGVAFLVLALQDRSSPAVAFLALAIHVGMPGGWYGGGYTELVQWGLVTNVAGAVAAFLMLPPTNRFVQHGDRRAVAVAAFFGAAAIYSNPRSAIGLAAIAAGVWLAQITHSNRTTWKTTTWRIAQVVFAVGLLAAPELLSLIRFSSLYTFVQYSGYTGIADFVTESASSTSAFVLALGIAGLAFAFGNRRHPGSLSAAYVVVVYGALTVLLVVVPALSSLAPQLEATRLMPMQRLLTIYLAASFIGAATALITKHLVGASTRLANSVLVVLAVSIIVVQTWPPLDSTPDPATPLVPASSLYPVAMSGQPVQADLAAAVHEADRVAELGTALLVIGSALSWHQQLWAPIWTERPLYYDNWLWYWHPNHSGTPGYRPGMGNHYPDPNQALQPEYLATHGVGAIVVTGDARGDASSANWLSLARTGTAYDVYRVVNPVSTVTFGVANASSSDIRNQRIRATSHRPSNHIEIRANWFPRWEPDDPEEGLSVYRAEDGTMELNSPASLHAIEMVYTVTIADWMARLLATLGVLFIFVLLGEKSTGRFLGRRWYAQPPDTVTSTKGARAFDEK